jgi:uncharacterized phage-associated protein
VTNPEEVEPVRETGFAMSGFTSTPVSAHDVARELRGRVPEAGQVQVHKWSYYAQAWHLILTGAPLFQEEIEAFAHGPLVASLWKDERYGRPRPKPKDLGEVGHMVLDLVVETYGSWPAWKLTEQTHREGPWRDLMENDGSSEPSPVISHESLLRWFESTGEAADVRARAFAREDADAGYARQVARIRESGVHSPEGRRVDDNVLAALNRASGTQHVADNRP